MLILTIGNHNFNSNLESTKVCQQNLNTPDNVSLNSRRRYNYSDLMEYTLHSPTFLKEMLRYFIDQAPKKLIDLKRFLNEKNAKRLYVVAHKFSPQLSYVGANELAILVNEIETKAMAGIFDDLEPIIDLLEHECTILIQQFRVDFNMNV